MRTEFFLNQQQEWKDIPPPTQEPLAFHRGLSGYKETPLVEAPELAQRLGIGQLFVKDESKRLGLPAFKILGAFWAIYRVLLKKLDGVGQADAGESPPSELLDRWDAIDRLAARIDCLKPLTLVTATDGNHGRAVAHVAARFKLTTHIFVPKGTAPARIDGIASEGAKVEVVNGTYEDAVLRAAEMASDNCLVISDTSWEGYKEIPSWIMEGYSTILWEIEDQLKRLGKGTPDLFPVQFGIGALATAVVRHYRGRGMALPRIVSVEPLHAACALASMVAGRIVTVPGPHDSIMAGLNCGLVSLVAWPVIAHGIDAFIAIDDERSREAMRALAAIGVTAGETGAAGLAGLFELLAGDRKAEFREALRISGTTSAVVIVTEGATDPKSYQEIIG